MNIEQAKERIKNEISCKDFLEKSEKGEYICSCCGSGTGPNKTGAVKYYPDSNTWHCHACNTGGDVIKLFQEKNNCDYMTALSLLGNKLNITIDSFRPTAAEAFAKTPIKRAERLIQEEPNYIPYYRECFKRLTDPAALSYLESRGISFDTAKSYHLGYDPAANMAKSGNHPCPRIIIAVSKDFYIGRRIDGKEDYKYMNTGHPEIFNKGTLYDSEVQEVFITESALDALSIIEAGAAAIALNSAANTNLLVKQLEQQRTDATLILSLDNDKAGKDATEKLKPELQRLNINFIIANVSGEHKDPNEALIADRETFINVVKKVQAPKPDNTTLYIDSLMDDEIEELRKAGNKKTGFKNLDDECRGLYPGLYVIAATSSLGKTTFSLQIADNLAAAGQDVLFFSLEQSRLELISKSFSRILASELKESINSLALRNGHYIEKRKAAAELYKDRIAERMSIIEGNFDCDISFICKYIRRYIRRNEVIPVVFIDYLQILQPAQETKKTNIRENVDDNITTLKRLSRDYGITIFVVSSINRSNYMTQIDFESLKESGGIEYTADVIWGLQLECLNDDLFNSQEKTQLKQKRKKIREAKAATPREIELVCLKNRYGKSNFNCRFDYYPDKDLFEEVMNSDDFKNNPFFISEK